MGYTEIDIPELDTVDTDVDNTPVPSESEKDFNDESPDEKLKLAQAAAAKFNREQFENNALLNIGVDDDFDDMPLESLRKVHQLQAFLAQQLNDFNIQDKFKETIEAFVQNQKKYTIPDLKISTVTMGGTIEVCGTVQHKQRVKDSWGNYKSTPVNTVFTGAKYNIFNKGWDLNTCAIQEEKPESLYRYSRSGYSRPYSSRSKDVDKIIPLLNTLSKQFEKTIKYNKHVDRLFTKYQEIINRLFNDSYIEEFGHQGINIQ